jgi:hypothetical protein
VLAEGGDVVGEWSVRDAGLAHLITDIEMALVGWSVGSRAALSRFLWAAPNRFLGGVVNLFFLFGPKIRFFFHPKSPRSPPPPPLLLPKNTHGCGAAVVRAVRWAPGGTPPICQLLDAQLRLRYAEVASCCPPGRGLATAMQGAGIESA